MKQNLKPQKAHVQSKQKVISLFTQSGAPISQPGVMQICPL